MEFWLIMGAVFVGVTCLVAAVMGSTGKFDPNAAEDRLQALAGGKLAGLETHNILKADLMGAGKGLFGYLSARINEKISGLPVLLEQADSPIDFPSFLMISGACSAVAMVGGWLGGLPAPVVSLMSTVAAFLPLMWLLYRRNKRFGKFAKQMPDAMELIARALRSGHALSSGLHVVVTEMAAPISTEFAIAYEEQNLGITIEQSLKNMLKRMPNMDLKFFVTAVAIQRTTGGDLAEILDKISHVIRERFKILGTVQALTGEGRLSGAVLMGMPIATFFAIYYLNPDYVSVLFTTEMGRQMIAVGAVMQIIGAVVIRKIIDIKV